MIYFLLGLLVASAFLALDIANNLKTMFNPEPVPVRVDS